MPPKRKVKDRDGAEESSPVTRRSTRSSTKIANAGSSSEHTRATGDTGDVTQPSKSNRKSRTKNGKTDVEEFELQASPPKKIRKTAGAGDVRHAVATRPAQKGKGPPHPPFTRARALELFNTYRDQEVSTEDIIGSEGLENLCSDAQLDMEGPKPLLLAWILGAKALGQFTKAEWEQGTSLWQLDTTDKFSVAIHDVQAILLTEPERSDSTIAKSTKKKETGPYNKENLHQYERDPSSHYRKFYLFLFDLLRPEQARNVDMEIATAIWGTVLAPKYPLCNELISFINDKKTYRGVNKDLWTMTLEFCQEFDKESLDNYETDGAWPTLIDDFVRHQRQEGQ